MAATSFVCIVTAVALSLLASCCRADMYAVPFERCSSDIPAPTTFRLECSRLENGTCVLPRGLSYAAIAQFVPAHSSSRVRSSLRRNTRIPVRMSGQDLEGCGEHMTCPLTPGALTTFVHSININRHCIAKAYPLKWQLKDRQTNEIILCFTFNTRTI
ncbi:uncharacterized protein LOC143023967 [Oratosquilla oratoria]|uniref:uncharacterized protein LOC143023967 n=1 Tax=Oratosquilla oratoria TaxID=337810 RepID=UPI003F76D109